jgi:hypothetical protein
VEPVSLVALGLLACFALGSFLFARRYGGGAALAELERANRILTGRVTELEAQDITKTRRIAELEARTDIALALMPVIEALHTHELAAAKRSEATLNLLGMIADRLGREAVA